MKGVGKLGAYQTKGGQAWDTREDENMLYLGAAQGVTPEWVRYKIPNGKLIAVEFSPVASLGLLQRAQRYENLIPYVGDARRPSTYAPLVPELGVLFQDVAQPNQIDIFERNMRTFGARRGFLAVKARSIAVERSPQEVIEDAVRDLERRGLDVVDVRRLEPFHKDHAMIVADPRE